MRKPTVRIRSLALALGGVVLLAASCATNGVGDTSPQAMPLPVLVQRPIDDLIERGPLLDEAAQLARRLVHVLETDAAATDALLLAIERGYSSEQLTSGVEADRVRGDGLIVFAEPVGSHLGRIRLSEPEVASHAQAQGSPQPRRRVRQADRATLDNYTRGDGILLDQLRGFAGDALRRDEQSFLIGIEGTAFILLLARAGLTPEQIVDTLILGTFFFEADDGRCYSRSFPISNDNPPQERQCDDAHTPEPSTETNDEPTTGLTVPTAEPLIDGATYRGNMPEDATMVESLIEVTISPDGAVTGRLTAREELTRQFFDLCGLMDDDEDCGENPSCPMTQLWSSDLSTLRFAGDPPDQGSVSGTIMITWETLATDCIDPETSQSPFEIEAIVSPDSAEITVPFSILLERVDS